jgi:hypothetical protein
MSELPLKTLVRPVPADGRSEPNGKELDIVTRLRGNGCITERGSGWAEHVVGPAPVCPRPIRPQNNASDVFAVEQAKRWREWGRGRRGCPASAAIRYGEADDPRRYIAGHLCVDLRGTDIPEICLPAISRHGDASESGREIGIPLDCGATAGRDGGPAAGSVPDEVPRYRRSSCRQAGRR